MQINEIEFLIAKQQQNASFLFNFFHYSFWYLLILIPVLLIGNIYLYVTSYFMSLIVINSTLFLLTFGLVMRYNKQFKILLNGTLNGNLSLKTIAKSYQLFLKFTLHRILKSQWSDNYYNINILTILVKNIPLKDLFKLMVSKHGFDANIDLYTNYLMKYSQQFNKEELDFIDSNRIDPDRVFLADLTPYHNIMSNINQLKQNIISNKLNNFI